jgi:hypothetical protein
MIHRNTLDVYIVAENVAQNVSWKLILVVL